MESVTVFGFILNLFSVEKSIGLIGIQNELFEGIDTTKE